MGRGKSGASGTRARNSEWEDGGEGYRVFAPDTRGGGLERANAEALGGRDWYRDMMDKGENYFYEKQGLRFAKDRTDKKDKEAGDALVAFRQYQNSSAATNGQLRSGEVSSAVATRARRMEKALDQSEIAVPFVAQRHANSALLGFSRQASVKDIQGMVGKVVVDQGFMSCVPFGGNWSFFAGDAAKGMGVSKSDSVMYHIAIPKGKGIGGNVGTGTVMSREFILNRGAALKVVGAYESGGTVHCNLEWVGREASPIRVKGRKRK